MKAFKGMILVFAFCLLFAGQAAAGISVGLLYSDSAPPADIHTILEENYLIDSVTDVDILSSTPLLADLQDFDVVVMHVNTFAYDWVAVGDLLADYIDLGGKGAVITVGALTSLAPLQGRFASGGYLPIDMGTHVGAKLWGTPEDHYIMHNIVGADESAVTSDGALATGAVSLGFFSDGTTYLGAVKGDVVALNYFIQSGGFMTWQKGWLVTSAITYLAMFNLWEEVAGLPAGRDSGGYVSDSTYNYWIGGNYSGKAQVDLLYRYDPGSDSWSTLTSLPTPLGGCKGVYFDGKIYVPGGHNGTAATCEMYIYDIASDSWSTGNACSLATTGYAAVYLDGFIYHLGGYDHVASNSVKAHRYDISLGTWEDLPDMAAKRWNPVAGALQNKIYVAGGNMGGTSAEAYDPDAGTWSDGDFADLPLQWDSGGTLAWNGLLYMVATRTNTTRAIAYDPVMDMWFNWPAYLNNATWINSATVLDGYLYSAGGYVEQAYHERTPICDHHDTIGCGDTVNGDTNGLLDYYNGYWCTDRNESGGEIKYLLNLAETNFVKVTLSAMTNDLDVFVLDDCDPSRCVEYADTKTSSGVWLDPGDNYIVVDGFEGAADTFTLELECCAGCMIDDTCYAHDDPNPANE